MLPADRLLALVGRIYDAVADSELWPAALKDFGDAVNGDVAALMHYDLPRPQVHWDFQSNWDPECLRRYAEYYSSINPWIARATRLKVQGAESITTSEELISFSDFKETEFYNDFANCYGTVHQLGGIIGRGDGWCSAVTCCRSPKSGPFGPAEVAFLRELFPHLQRAIQFHRRMAELEGCYRASLDALDHLPACSMFQGRVLIANRAAQQILSQSDGLNIEKRELAASTASQARELRAGIAGATLTARGKGVGAGGSLAIVRPSGKRPLTVVVMPVSVHAFSPDAREPAVIVFVSDPETRMQTAPEILARVYGLTAAESRLAEQLMQGEPVVLAAERLSISHNTARTHLQRIYQKTNTSHQADLVRLLLSSALRP